MENIKITVTNKLSKKAALDLVVVLVTQEIKTIIDNPDGIPKEFLKACELGDFKGSENDKILLYDSKVNNVTVKRLAYIGVGKIKSLKDAELSEQMRLVGGRIAALCKQVKARRVCIISPESKDEKNKITAKSLVEGVMLGSYTFKKFKTKKEDDGVEFKGIAEIKVFAQKGLTNIRKITAEAKIGAIATCHARNMANEPGSSWTPNSFANYAKDISKSFGLKCKVFEKKALEKMGMGGILGVNQGSTTPPKLIVVEHIVSKKAKTVVLVGKGLTFDSGGISLKPASGMDEMKYDMCGGAAVLATMRGVGEIKPNFNIIGIVPTTDNMPGGSALKPGDIIYHYNKVSSEIINTDAEGRLILADALSYAVEKYEPDFMIDLATLTGAVIIGLGHHNSGLLTNSDKLARKLTEAGDCSGEPLWRLPLGKHYTKQLDSKVADIKNTGGRAGGTITAAEYLQKFVGKTPWAHLDIAGTAWNFTEKSYIPKGSASGICVRTLLQFIKKVEMEIKKTGEK